MEVNQLFKIMRILYPNNFALLKEGLNMRKHLFQVVANCLYSCRMWSNWENL